MNPGQQKAVILALLQELRKEDSYSAETHVQKCCHFLQEGLGVPLGVEFIMYKHGPFSFDLREALGAYRAARLIELEPMPPYGPRLRPTDSGAAFLERFPKTTSRFSKQINFVAEELGSLDVVELEKIGTALFVTSESSGADEETRARSVVDLKPRIDETSALAAVRRVDDLLAKAAR